MAVHAPACPRTGPRPDDLYRHAPNKAALLDGVAEIVLAQLKVDIADRDWVSQLRTVARDYRALALALAHPHRGATAGHPAPGYPAGAPPARHPAATSKMSWSCSPAPVTADPGPCTSNGALFGLLHGHVLNEMQELVEKPDETDDLLRLGLHRLPIGEFPLLRSLAPVLASYDGAAELERGLDILLTGLTTTLIPEGD